MGLFSWSIKTALIRVDPNSMPRIAFPASMVDFASAYHITEVFHGAIFLCIHFFDEYVTVDSRIFF